MLNSFYAALFTVVFFIGVIVLLFEILMRVIRPENGETNYIVVVLDGTEKSAVARISYLLTRVSAAGDKRFTKIIAVDNGLTPEQYKTLLNAFSAESRVVVCPRESFQNAIFENHANKGL